MTDNNDCFIDLMDTIDGDENFRLFNELIELAMSGNDWDRQVIDIFYAEDRDKFDRAVCRYLQSIRRRNHAAQEWNQRLDSE